MSNRLMNTLQQGNEESIVYKFTTTKWGAAPSAVTMKVWDVSIAGARTDVTATVGAGTAEVVGDEISLPAIHSLTAGNTYRVEIKFTSGGNIYEPFFIIEAAY